MALSSRFIVLQKSWARRSLRILVGLAVVASMVFVVDGGAEAVQVPATLTDRRPAQVGPVEPGFPIDYLGVVWETAGRLPFSAGGDLSGEPHGEVRFRIDGSWGPWMPLVQDDVQGPGHWGSSLVSGGDAEAYQVRGMPSAAALPRVVAINTTDGPLVAAGQHPSGASALTSCLSRSEWSADESLRFVDGVESWPVAFEPVRVMTVHHTATANSDPDPAATVRAIYVYHTVDRDWGDIAYQYLIDESGRVYEGRWSGEDSIPCGEGGDGSDFGYDEATAELVTGGHTYCYNRGNLGMALLGDFTSVEPTPAARAALESALADSATRHGLDPLGTIFYEAPNDMEACMDTVDASIEAIAAHTDWPDPAGATACPGNTFYPQMAGVRANVALLMGLELPSVTVGGVQYDKTVVGRGMVRTLSVTISLDPPLTEATVSATVMGPSSVSSTSLTGAEGSIVITIRRPASGCYTTAVTTVDAPGWVWDGLTPGNEVCL